MKKPVLIGLVVGFIAIIPRLLHYYTDLLTGFAFNRIDLFSIGLIYLAVPISILLVKREFEKGQFFFAEAFKSGMKTVGIAALILAAFTYIYFRFIDLETSANMIEAAVKTAKEEGANREQIDQILEGGKRFFSPFTQATSALLFTLFGGAIISIISSVFLSRFAR